MGCGDETHEPMDNLESACVVRTGMKVYLTSDGPTATGDVVKIFLDGPMLLAELKTGQKLKDMGCGDETHEPVENLTPA